MKNNRVLTKFFIKKRSLIFRDGDTLEEKFFFEFNFLQVLCISILLLLFLFFFNIFIAKNIFKNYLDPSYIQSENKKKIFKLHNKIIILKNKLVEQSSFIEVLKKHISSSTSDNKTKNIDYQKKSKIKQKTYIKEIIENNLGANKENFIKNSTGNLDNLNFFLPLKGIITSKFDIEKKHYGVDIVGKENAPISTIADGIIIFASWTIETGYNVIIQHKYNLVSIYKHLSQIWKDNGDYVTKGDVLGIIGTSGNTSEKRHLHLEIYYQSVPIDPENYLIF